MATRFIVGDSGGVARTVKRLIVGDSGGVARVIKRAFVGDSGGVARLIFQAFAPPSPFNVYDVWADSFPGDNAVATISFLSDGTITTSMLDSDGGSTIGSSNWGQPTTTGIGANYWIRLTATSGTFTTNGASGWTNLASTVSATKSAFSGTASVTFTIEIATDAAGANIVLTSTGNTLRYSHT
jgi:hypothetical protein